MMRVKWARLCSPPKLEQLNQLAGGNSCLTEDRAKRAPVNLTMIGNDCLGKGIITPQNNVAAVLPTDRKAHFLECPNDIRTGNLRQFAHTAMSKASKCSSGSGKPSS